MRGRRQGHIQDAFLGGGFQIMLFFGRPLPNHELFVSTYCFFKKLGGGVKSGHFWRFIIS